MPNSPVLKIVCAIRMERTTRKNRNVKQRKCYRNRNLVGGGLGSGYANGPEMLARGYPVTESYSSCGAVSRPGMLTSAQISSFQGGLPGLAGGSRRMRKGKSKGKGKGSRKSQRRRSTRRRMRGGRYTMALDGTEFSALGPRGGMMATAERIPCESGVPPHVSQTAPTQPAVAMSGGALQLAPTPFLQEQTAGYSQGPSSFLDSVGAPILLNNPVGGRMGVPACAQTGGRRKQRKSRKQRKQRKQRKH
jgi:hypothetical protein